ncbi:MAG: glycosyltransferase [Deltaproteobacteria bacterium]|nr:glycosyltransferase [Deltaproteobacteria bacterium]
MELFQILILSVYFSVLVILAVYGLHRYYLSYLFYRHRDNYPKNLKKFTDLKNVPFLTIQLPIFNERYVAGRLIESICELSYPADKLEIQVLDDSTDDTVNIVAGVVERLQTQGYDIVHLHRKDRRGFKAGALAAGMKVAKGELIAVFDADFLPQVDFLEKLIPYFETHPKVGMVQARWGHINREYSLLTQAQSIFLDGHFVIEHTARNRSGRFFNFNGTAGVWRKECIIEAGGWEHDTLTEDLDLSYRAQMKGWQFIFVPDVIAPAELPVEINAFKSQQHRWAKGSIQTAIKLVPKILRAPLPLRVKSEALFHLTNNLAYLLMVVLSILMPISLAVRYDVGWVETIFIDLPFFMSATFSVTFFYCCSQRAIYSDWTQRLKYIPFNLALGIGLSVNNAKAVLEALFQKESEFVRTPKYAILKKGDDWKDKKYKKKVSLVTVFEFVLAGYFLFAIYYAATHALYVSIPFLLLFLTGYLYLALLSLFQSKAVTAFFPVLRSQKNFY